jgi:hypothetical protein
MKCKLMSIVVLSTILVGCNDEKKHDETVKKEEASTVSSVQIETSKVNSVQEGTQSDQRIDLKGKDAKHVASPKLATNKGQSKALNGVKFILTDGIVEKGAQVYNTSMNEPGVVKGSVVVVLARAGVLDKSQFKTVTKIADKTFRLWPLKQEDLYKNYQKLASDSNYSTVEIEVDYSPISKQQTH